MGALQWMGAVRMRVQTADKNIKNKSKPNQTFESGEKSAQIKRCLQAKKFRNRSKQICDPGAQNPSLVAEVYLY